jgi:hypothetical protein
MDGGLLAAARGQTVLACLVYKYLVKIAWHGPEEISSSLATSLMMNVQSALTKSCTFAVSSFLLHKGCLECSSLSTDVCRSWVDPLQNLHKAHGRVLKSYLNRFTGSSFLKFRMKFIILVLFHTFRHYEYGA